MPFINSKLLCVNRAVCFLASVRPMGSFISKFKSIAQMRASHIALGWLTRHTSMWPASIQLCFQAAVAKRLDEIIAWVFYALYVYVNCFLTLPLARPSYPNTSQAAIRCSISSSALSRPYASKNSWRYLSVLRLKPNDQAPQKRSMCLSPTPPLQGQRSRSQRYAIGRASGQASPTIAPVVQDI